MWFERNCLRKINMITHNQGKQNILPYQQRVLTNRGIKIFANEFSEQYWIRFDFVFLLHRLSWIWIDWFLSIPGKKIQFRIS